MPPSIEQLSSMARQTALLVDSVRAAAAAAEIVDAPAGAVAEDERAWARLRLAELLRRVAPERALEGIAQVTGDPEAERIRCHALLDLLRFEEARDTAARIAWADGTDSDQPRFAVVRARLDVLTDRGLAIIRLRPVILAADTPAEVRAEGLNLRARWLAEAGDYVGAIADLDLLDHLAREHDAPATLGLAQLYRRLYQALEGADPGHGGARMVADTVLGAITAGVDYDPAKLGPIPAHVHALLVRFGGADKQPGAYLLAMYQVAGLLEAAGLMDEAYATLHYGAMLAARMFDADLAASLASRRQLLLSRVGEDRARALQDREEARAAEFLGR